MAESAQTLEVPTPSGNISVVWKKTARSRSIRLRVSRNGAVVSSPPRTPVRIVEAFLLSHAPWLSEHAAKISALPMNTVLLQGKWVNVVAIPPLEQKRHGAHWEGDTLFLNPSQPSADSAAKQLERFLREQAATTASPLLTELAQRMNIHVPALRFRETSSRWGSCTSAGAITLNWRLIHAPLRVVRYVIIHELAHRVHMNHSAAFWELVEQYDSHYRIHRGWLKRWGHFCVTPPLTFSKPK